jgi:hypothetical protein
MAATGNSYFWLVDFYASYQVSIHLAKWFSEKKICLENNQSETKIACGGHL